MGLGDELMAAGQARALREAEGENAPPVVVLGNNQKPRLHPIFEMSPDVWSATKSGKVYPPPDAKSVLNGPDARPYIDYRASLAKQHWAWREFRATPARIVLPQSYRDWAAARIEELGGAPVIVQPHVKGKAPPAKMWGWERWQALVDMLPDVPWLQIGRPGEERLRGIASLETPRWQHALAVMAHSWGAVLQEGFLHHAAAAFGRPAVVIFGAYISPALTGYEGQTNLYTGQPDSLGCGSRAPCQHCEEAMAAITPEMVAAHVRDMLERNERPMVEQSRVELCAPVEAYRASEPYGLKEWAGLWLPEGEQHLIDWMAKNGTVIDGRQSYQWEKIRASLDHVNAACRTAIDVGAHCGLWSMHLTKRFAHVEAFEPVELHRRAFARNVRGGGTVNLWACALGDSSGYVTMSSNPSSSGDTWVKPGSVSDEAATESAVPLRRLDDLLLDGAIEGPVDFIKLDCEGFELFVLRGGEQLLRRWKPVVVVEQKPGRAEKFGLGRTDAVPYLKSLGAQLRREMGGDYLLTWDRSCA